MFWLSWNILLDSFVLYSMVLTSRSKGKECFQPIVYRRSSFVIWRVCSVAIWKYQFLLSYVEGKARSPRSLEVAYIIWRQISEKALVELRPSRKSDTHRKPWSFLVQALLQIFTFWIRYWGKIGTTKGWKILWGQKGEHLRVFWRFFFPRIYSRFVQTAFCFLKNILNSLESAEAPILQIWCQTGM